MPALANAAGLLTPLSLLRAASQVAGAVTGSGVDLQGYEGAVLFVQDVGPITGTLSANKLQHSDVVATGYVDVDQQGQAFGTTQNVLSTVLSDTRKLKRFVRYVATITTGPAGISVVAHALKAYRP